MSVKLLTPKQYRFCLEYLNNENGTAAAVAAGYSVKTARWIAAQNLTKLHITQKIEELREKAASDAIMTRSERVRTLSEIGRADLTQFVDSNGNIDITGPGAGVLAEVVVTDFKGGKGGRAESRTKKVKLYDKLEAIDILNRMDRVYAEAPGVSIDNRKLVIVVTGETEKALLSEVIEGVAPHTCENAQVNNAEKGGKDV